MSDITLYIAPGSCSRVSCIALEELGLAFESRVVRFMQGEHKSPEYKKHNPKGKVPTLIYKGEPLTENVAIASFLNATYGGLMPKTSSAMETAQQIADLCFCATTLHPIVTRIRMPMFFAGNENARLVKEAGMKAMDEYFQLIEERLNNGIWWYDDEWSIMDAYLYWFFWRVEGADYDVSRFPAYQQHAKRMEQRPAVQRALQREADAQKILESEGLLFIPPKV